MLFTFPANIDSVSAPLGTSAAGSNRFAFDFDKDGIAVNGGQDANGNPARVLDINVPLEFLE